MALTTLIPKKSSWRLKGFTLLEVLVSSVVILVATIGSIAAFNVITQSIRGTGLRADQSRRIDAQIAEISLFSEIYTACVNPLGAIPADLTSADTACGSGSIADGVEIGNSYYYFPATPANGDLFYAACRSNSAATNITANFVAAINNNANLPQPGGGVTRSPGAKVDPTDSSSHVVEVEWVETGNPARILRSIRVTPLVSSWCP